MSSGLYMCIHMHTHTHLSLSYTQEMLWIIETTHRNAWSLYSMSWLILSEDTLEPHTDFKKTLVSIGMTELLISWFRCLRILH